MNNDELIIQKLDEIIEILNTKHTRNRGTSNNTNLLKDLINQRIEQQGFVSIDDKTDLIEKSGVSQRTWYRVLSTMPKFTHNNQLVWALTLPNDNVSEIDQIKQTIHTILSEGYECDTAEFVDEVFHRIGENHRTTKIGTEVMKIIGDLR